MSGWFSWLRAGKSDEDLKDELIVKVTKLKAEEGIWICLIRTDITRDYMRKYLINYMKEKGFQAISTGSQMITFQQDLSSRRCACTFTIVQGQKRVRYEYYDGDKIDPASPASIFFQSILIELASQLADSSMLYTQPYKPLERIPTSLSSIADENMFLNPKEHFWVAFLRSDASDLAKKVIVRYLGGSRFAPDPASSDKMAICLLNKELYLRLKILVGYNSKEQLLVHAFYSALERPKVVDSDDSDEEDDEEEEEEEEEEDNAKSSASAIPNLRKGDEEYFQSLLLGLGRELAQHELLRTQEPEFEKTAIKVVAPTEPEDYEDEEDEEDEEVGDRQEDFNEDALPSEPEQVKVEEERSVAEATTEKDVAAEDDVAEEEAAEAAAAEAAEKEAAEAAEKEAAEVAEKEAAEAAEAAPSEAAEKEAAEAAEKEAAEAAEKEAAEAAEKEAAEAAAAEAAEKEAAEVAEKEAAEAAEKEAAEAAEKEAAEAAEEEAVAESPADVDVVEESPVSEEAVEEVALEGEGENPNPATGSLLDLSGPAEPAEPEAKNDAFSDLLSF